MFWVKLVMAMQIWIVIASAFCWRSFGRLFQADLKAHRPGDSVSYAWLSLAMALAFAHIALIVLRPLFALDAFIVAMVSMDWWKFGIVFLVELLGVIGFTALIFLRTGDHGPGERRIMFAIIAILTAAMWNWL